MAAAVWQAVTPGEQGWVEEAAKSQSESICKWEGSTDELCGGLLWDCTNQPDDYLMLATCFHFSES